MCDKARHAGVYYGTHYIAFSLFSLVFQFVKKFNIVQGKIFDRFDLKFAKRYPKNKIHEKVNPSQKKKKKKIRNPYNTPPKNRCVQARA